MRSHLEHRPGVHVHAVGKSVRGKVRAVNQDRLLLAHLGQGVTDPTRIDDDGFSVGPVDLALGEAGVLLMVADGMGGRLGGERASESAVSVVGAEMTFPTEPTSDAHGFVQRLDRALAKANEAIHAEGTREQQYRGMGTTATLVGLHDGCAYVAQVGDSRAYLARGGSLTRLTRDQSLVQDLIDMGVLTEEDARNAPNNQILQALGATPTVRPALTYQDLRRGDVILLCSDGLSKVVRDEEVQAAVAAATDCAALCDDLVALANARGGPDNITLLVARIGGGDIDEPGEGDAVQRREYPPLLGSRDPS